MVTNLQIKFIKSLQLKKNRVENQSYVCEGEKIVRELLNYNLKNVIQIYATDMWISANSAYQEKTTLVSKKELERMGGLSTTPDVLAWVKIPEKSTIKNIQTQPIYLYLDKISDPGNLGTIIRTADWYGLKDIFISPATVDVYSPKVIQSAMGSHFRIRCIESELGDLVQSIPFQDIFVTAMEGDSIDIIQPKQSSLLIMGSESHGASEIAFRLSTRKITIPAFSKTESLNVSVATGIILHQFMRRIQ